MASLRPIDGADDARAALVAQARAWVESPTGWGDRESLAAELGRAKSLITVLADMVDLLDEQIVTEGGRS